MLQYPVRLKADHQDGGFVATFRDIPEAITQGETEEEAMCRAGDALEAAMEFYFDDRRPVPTPSDRKRGERFVDLPLSQSLKIMLLNEMLAQQVRAGELARRLDISKQEVNRLTTLRHATKSDRIEAALAVLGKRVTVQIVPAA